MLIILERDRFIKLFKFGELKVNINRFIDGYDTIDKYRKIPVELLDDKIPFFEQDHEVLVLEIHKEELSITPEILLRISQVRKVFPLTAEAKRFLIGKMNPLIVLHDPLFDEQAKKLKINRDLKLRIRAKDSLLRLYGINKSFSASYDQVIEQGIKVRLNSLDKPDKGNYLFHLISFNRNPVYPSGSIEYLFKAASVFVEMNGGTEKVFESGPFYEFLKANSSNLSGRKLSECITFVLNSKESETIKSELKKQYPEVDTFTIGVWYLYFKDKLNQNDYDLEVISDEIISLKESSPKEIAVILHMLGVLFSFDNLYESIYKMKKIPIFDQTPLPGIAEQKEKLLKQLREKDDVIVQLEKEIAKIKEAKNIIKEKQTTELVKVEKKVEPQSKPDEICDKEIASSKPENETEHNKVKEDAEDADRSKTRKRTKRTSNAPNTRKDGASEEITAK